jgi:hypothetical protein
MKNKAPLIIASLLAVLYWLIVLFEIPVFQTVPGYFWHFMHYVQKPVMDYWFVLPVLLIAALALFIVRRFRNNRIVTISTLVLAGYLMHMGLGFMDGRGIDSFRIRKLASGHSEFVRMAAAEPGFRMITDHYETMLEENPVVEFCRTKPPGQLLFYVFTQRIANIVMPATGNANKVLNLTTFISYVWPLLAFLVIWPLYYLAKNV